MPIKMSVMPKFYKDSVSLMQTAAAVMREGGLSQVSIVMGSPANLALLREAGLVGPEGLDAGANDLIIAVEGEAEAAVDKAVEQAVALLRAGARDADEAEGEGAPARNGLGAGLDRNPEANLAVIATPGEYAAAEALKAVRQGLNVMLFSDNVTAADERCIKEAARERGLLVMGPDCGTAIIDGVPLAFANVVARGSVGVVGASGTGIQQITTLLDNLGGGISHAIGTGGHDLSAEVGGISMLQGIAMLAEDPGTKVIVIVSKPPHPEVCEAVIAAAAASGKPVVANFIGPEWSTHVGGDILFVRTLEDAAVAALRLAGNAEPPAGLLDATGDLPAPGRGRRWIRGVYTGGTFCYEATYLLGERLGAIRSNTPVRPGETLSDPWRSLGHTLVDMGDDVFTRGRPHPMIDPSLRLDRMRKEAGDPETAVVLFDLVLGHGSHPDPATGVAEVIRESRAGGGGPVFVGFVCGTSGDPQGFEAQKTILREAGAVLARTNARAVDAAATVAEAGNAATQQITE
ncbi:MAG: acyl-CoA synthetase FdrA [Pseudodesulfovibrio sp.]|uniref:acyl-CoA synthetase FdrA n=1 Tax=Pseudodesulfovibrio sp. TaxID=2035812 RepID=UPI003D0DD20E